MTMKLRFSSQVDGHYLEVFKRFDKKLFTALKPPLLPMEILRFDGSEKGCEVHLSLGKKPLNMSWVSLITESQINSEQAYFIDEGSVLPPPLVFWKHQHIVLNHRPNSSIIVDSIEYRTPHKIIDWLVYPALYLQFVIRGPVYKRFFKNSDT